MSCKAMGMFVGAFVVSLVSEVLRSSSVTDLSLLLLQGLKQQQKVCNSSGPRVVIPKQISSTR